jgi:hypothetical protein
MTEDGMTGLCKKNAVNPDEIAEAIPVFEVPGTIVGRYTPMIEIQNHKKCIH